MSRPALTTWLVLGGALFVSVTLNQISARVGKPLLQTERLLESFGWQDGDLELLGGGYSTRILSGTAHATYRSVKANRKGDVHIEISRPLPFSDWKITQYSHLKPATEPEDSGD